MFTKGRCLRPRQVQRFTCAMVEAVGIDVKVRGTGYHSWRIAKRAALASGMKSGDFADIFVVWFT